MQILWTLFVVGLKNDFFADINNWYVIIAMKFCKPPNIIKPGVY